MGEGVAAGCCIRKCMTPGTVRPGGLLESENAARVGEELTGSRLACNKSS